MTVGDFITQLQEISGGDIDMNITIGYYDEERDVNSYKKFCIDIIDGAVGLDLSGNGVKKKGCLNPEVFIYFDQGDAHQTDNEVK